MTTTAHEQRTTQVKRFFVKGVSVAILSGILYGVYSASLLAATGSGEWLGWYGDWYAAGEEATLGGVMLSFAMACLILGALGSGINDFISAIWMVGKAAVKGKLRDFFRCYASKPGAVMVVCALIGGPIASTAYLIALTMSGPIATPVSALCPAIGALIGRVLFKQELNARMVCGILVCIVATFMIGSSAFNGIEVNTQFLLGLLIAFIAALGWGIEGAVAGFGTSAMDYEIGISIRQTTSGIFTLFVLTPALFIIAGNMGLYPTMLFEALTGPLLAPETFTLASPLVFFLISGLAAGLSFGFWYKGNSMCGAALGMACNGGFSFWVPFFSFLICGVYLGWGFDASGALDVSTGYVLTPIQWAAAIVMVVGIFLIAVNPLAFFQKNKAEAGEGEQQPLGDSAALKGAEAMANAADVAKKALEEADDAHSAALTPAANSSRPFYYAVLKLFGSGREADTLEVLDALKPCYASSRQLRVKTITEALMTAEANGLIAETRSILDKQGALRVYYQATPEGAQMIASYIK